MRPVVQQSDRLNDALSDMSLNERGERVIAEAVAERRRREERDRARQRTIKTGIEAEEAEAQRQRLLKRFTNAGGLSRRHTVMYDDGTSRYERL